MRSKEFLLVRKNHATVKPDSSVVERHSSWNQNLDKRRIEMRNLHILKKILEKSMQFLWSEQPRETKSLDAALNIAGV